MINEGIVGHNNVSYSFFSKMYSLENIMVPKYMIKAVMLTFILVHPQMKIQSSFLQDFLWNLLNKLVKGSRKGSRKGNQITRPFLLLLYCTFMVYFVHGHYELLLYRIKNADSNILLVCSTEK